MRVDFYQLSRDPVEQVVPLLATKVLATGAKLAVACEDAGMREMISQSLWAAGGGAFLAHGHADELHEARQPILLSEAGSKANGAGMAIFADGKWREEATGFERVMLLFGAEKTDDARNLWRALSDQEGFDLHIFKQQPSGAWREGR